jgi:hypothetical protein
MQRVEAAEKQLLEARRAAKKAFKENGNDTEGMFGESVFVLRKNAERWVEEARREKAELTPPEPAPKPKTAAQEYAARMRSRDLSKPLPVEPLSAEAREAAVAARWAAATPEERAKMIVEAASKGVRPRSNK